MSCHIRRKWLLLCFDQGETNPEANALNLMEMTDDAQSVRYKLFFRWTLDMLDSSGELK
jgi:hypothetical protein